VPRNADYGLGRPVQEWIGPVSGRLPAGGLEKPTIFGVGHFVTVYVERAEMNAMARRLIRVFIVSSHPELAGRHEKHCSPIFRLFRRWLRKDIAAADRQDHE